MKNDVKFGSAMFIGPTVPYRIACVHPDVGCKARYFSLWVHWMSRYGLRFNTRQPNLLDGFLEDGRARHVHAWDMFEPALENLQDVGDPIEWKHPIHGIHFFAERFEQQRKED